MEARGLSSRGSKRRTGDGRIPFGLLAAPSVSKMGQGWVVWGGLTTEPEDLGQEPLGN